MIELFLAIVLLTLGGSTGYLFSRKYSKRVRFFRSIYQFNNDFINELGFCKRNLNSILSKKYESDELNEMLEQIKNSFYNNLSQDVSKTGVLKSSEIYDMDNYFSLLGKSDCETQLKILNTYSGIFEQKLKEVTMEQNKYGSLCKKTGIIIGLIAFVIAV